VAYVDSLKDKRWQKAHSIEGNSAPGLHYVDVVHDGCADFN
jgi:hypothetical protein